jgi:4-hydroxybenzoyl-CoA reductase alpha subunit
MSKQLAPGYLVIGKDLPYIDSKAKVAGDAQYIEDLSMPGMLYGKILRSPISHGKILNIDTSRAASLNGVKAVITAKDTHGIKYGFIIPDEQILAEERVRFIGDEVATVAAVDKDTAMEALKLIKVEYEEIPSVFDPEKAMAAGTPLLHESKNNIAHKVQFTRGNFADGIDSADYISEGRFETPCVHQSYLEPSGCIAFFDASGTLNLWLPCQKIFLTRSLLARALNMPVSKIRVIQPSVGGAFGGKMDQKLPAVISLLALKTRRPVKVIITRDEEFITCRPRVATIIKLIMGIKKDGTVVAKKSRIIADNGAYSSYAPSILNTIAMRHDNAYRFKNLDTKAYLVYTNKVPTGAFRGFGNPQVTFAVESMLDILAEKAGIDPVEIRLKNATRSGDVTIHGWNIRSGGLSACIEKASKEIKWKDKKKNIISYQGVGIACTIHVCGNRASYDFDGSSAFIKLNEDGNIDLLIGEGDIGQGARTIFAQIAAEVLGVSLDSIYVSAADTAITPYCLGASASRVTFVGGNAVKAAATSLRAKVLDIASEILETSKDDLEIREGNIFTKTYKDKSCSLGDVAQASLHKKQGQPLMEKGTFDADSEKADQKTLYGNISGAYSFGAHIAHVEVDVKTGKVTILDYSAAHDLGRALNPMAAKGQIIGGISQGIGYALTEELLFHRGKIINPTFSDYKILSAKDMPPVRIITVETIDPAGPFGAKGLAETTLIPVAAAISNAIYDAVGVRIKSLPISPDSILKSLEEKKNRESL